MDPNALVALPVVCATHGPHDDSVRNFVEGVLGWQVIDATTAPLLPPALQLTDRHAEASGSPTPTVLLVDREDDPAAIAAWCVRGRPDAVVQWPRDRDQLAAEVAELLRTRPATRVDEPKVIRLGGGAGGVGTTTLTIALAALAGWRGRSTVAVLRTSAHVRRPAVIEPAATASADLYRHATPLPGCPVTRVVVAVGDLGVPNDPQVQLSVVDGGVDVDGDVLIVARDRANLDAIDASSAGYIIVVGDGPASWRDVAAVAGGRQVVAVPWSSRVRRAGHHRRLPTGLPGRWLRSLVPVLEAVR